MAKSYCKLKLTGLQIKSLKKAKKLAKALAVIEEECGIHTVKIIFKNTFVCGDMDLHDLNGTEMEKLIRDALL